MKLKNTTLVLTIIAFLFTGLNFSLAQSKVNKDKVKVKKHTMMKDSTMMNSKHMTDMKKMMKKCKAMMDSPEMKKMMKNMMGKMMSKMMSKKKGDMKCKMMDNMKGNMKGKMKPDSSKKMMNDAIHKSHHPDKKSTKSKAK